MLSTYKSFINVPLTDRATQRASGVRATHTDANDQKLSFPCLLSELRLHWKP